MTTTTFADRTSGGHGSAPAAGRARGGGTVLVSLAAALLVAGLSLSACGLGSAQPQLGTLRVALTDAPTDELQKVVVFFERIQAQRKGGHLEPLAEDLGPFDLLELQDRSVDLLSTGVEPGQYEFIRVVLDEERSHVVDLEGERQPLRIARTEVDVRGRTFDVSPGKRTTVVIDFDAEGSLLDTSSGWFLSPLISIASIQASQGS